MPIGNRAPDTPFRRPDSDWDDVVADVRLQLTPGDCRSVREICKKHKLAFKIYYALKDEIEAQGDDVRPIPRPPRWGLTGGTEDPVVELAHARRRIELLEALLRESQIDVPEPVPLPQPERTTVPTPQVRHQAAAAPPSKKRTKAPVQPEPPAESVSDQVESVQTGSRQEVQTESQLDVQTESQTESVQNGCLAAGPESEQQSGNRPASQQSVPDCEIVELIVGQWALNAKPVEQPLELMARRLAKRLSVPDQQASEHSGSDGEPVELNAEPEEQTVEQIAKRLALLQAARVAAPGRKKATKTTRRGLPPPFNGSYKR